jgi:hypothetical protein
MEKLKEERAFYFNQARHVHKLGVPSWATRHV